MKRTRPDGSDNEITIFTANVLQDNRQFGRMLQQIRSTDPDIIFLVETDTGWQEALKELEKDYEYRLAAPLDNTYGLLFYSRLRMEKGKVNFLVKDDIPSVDVVLQLRNGQKVQLWGLHPEPPAPNEALYSTAKDKELMKIALRAKECSLPIIVFGDLNDVAWSHITELFRKTSELLDPRRGRGFYNTFSAYHWFIRFPLDYIFCSAHFRLIHMKRMPKNGSDHFATFTHLYFSPVENKEDAPSASNSEKEEAREIAYK
jgi:endonuclease/exonuclease/phosphatase (EEP) superfamily protein YafD